MFDAHRAMKLQEILACRVLETLEQAPPLDINRVKYVAAFDSSYKDGRQYAVIVVYSVVDGGVVEKTYSVVDVKVPYIPGLLAFREVPGYMRAYGKLRYKPDLLLIDGHGLAHPRAFGIATHLGVVLGKPSIGVAKKKLYGELVAIDERVFIKAHGKIVGEVLKHGNTELYVSIGYNVKIEDATAIVKKLLVEGKKLPIPLQIADEYSKTIKNK